jgi:hypothetical protein
LFDLVPDLVAVSPVVVNGRVLRQAFKQLEGPFREQVLAEVDQGCSCALLLVLLPVARCETQHQVDLLRRKIVLVRELLSCLAEGQIPLGSRPSVSPRLVGEDR